MKLIIKNNTECYNLGLGLRIYIEERLNSSEICSHKIDSEISLLPQSRYTISDSQNPTAISLKLYNYDRMKNLGKFVLDRKYLDTVLFTSDSEILIIVDENGDKSPRLYLV